MGWSCRAPSLWCTLQSIKIITKSTLGDANLLMGMHAWVRSTSGEAQNTVFRINVICYSHCLTNLLTALALYKCNRRLPWTCAEWVIRIPPRGDNDDEMIDDFRQRFRLFFESRDCEECYDNRSRAESTYYFVIVVTIIFEDANECSCHFSLKQPNIMWTVLMCATSRSYDSQTPKNDRCMAPANIECVRETGSRAFYGEMTWWLERCKRVHRRWCWSSSFTSGRWLRQDQWNGRMYNLVLWILD